MRYGTGPFPRFEYRWRVFGAIAIGMFVSVADQTGVNLALPPLADHFDAAIPVVQWVALGYSLTVGSLLLPMGRLSDIIGRKRVYTLGFSIFTLGAILAGSSTALLAAILFRVFEGVGAAMVQANGMAILTSAFPTRERGKVIGLFMTVVGVGAVAGPIVGGAVVGFWGWRYVFFISAPFGLLSIVAAILVLEGGAPSRERRDSARSEFDWIGAGLSATALVIFLLAMTNAYRLGWGSFPVVAGLAGVAVLLAAFVRWEQRAPAPILAMELFKRRLFSLGTSASFLNFLAGSSVYFLMPFYLQGVLDYTPAQAGLIITPSAICFGIMGPIAGRLSDRFGPRRFEILGLIVLGLSLLVMSRITVSSPVELVVAALLLQGVGMGAFFSPNASSVLSVVESSRFGIATAYLNMIRNTASVTGVGMATTIVVAVMASMGYEPSLDVVASAAGGQGVKEAFVQGLRTAFLASLGLVAFATVLSVVKGGTPATEGAPSEAELPAPPAR